MHRTAGVFLALLALAGCMSSRVEESKNAETGIASGQSVVILATSYHKGQAVEEDFVECQCGAIDGALFQQGQRLCCRGRFLQADFFRVKPAFAARQKKKFIPRPDMGGDVKRPAKLAATKMRY